MFSGFIRKKKRQVSDSFTEKHKQKHTREKVKSAELKWPEHRSCFFRKNLEVITVWP